MRCSEIAFDGGHVLAVVVLLLLAIFAAADAAVLLVHVGDDPNGAFWLELEELYKESGLHRDDNAGTVIEGACAQIPRIEMAADDHDLVRLLTSLQVSDDVITRRIGKRLRCERHVN